MATGLRIRNQATGQLQIASGYRNLELIKSGVLDTNTFIGGGTTTFTRERSGFLMSTVGNDYLHVIRFPSELSGQSGFAVGQEVNSFKVYVNQASPSKQLEYYTFGYAAAQPTGPVGLRLRNQDGTVYYDSRRKGLRVLAAVALPDGPLTGTVPIGQFFPGRRIGLALANPRFYYLCPNPQTCSMLSDRLHLDANNNVYLSRLQLWSQNRQTAFTVGNFTMANADATMLVVDLTEVPLGFTA